MSVVNKGLGWFGFVFVQPLSKNDPIIVAKCSSLKLALIIALKLGNCKVLKAINECKCCVVQAAAVSSIGSNLPSTIHLRTRFRQRNEI